MFSKYRKSHVKFKHNSQNYAIMQEMTIDKMNSYFFCKNGKVSHIFTTYMVNLEDYIVIVKNVPCEECSDCGEKYFSDEVMEKFEVIVKKARELAGEVYVTDFSKEAA